MFKKIYRKYNFTHVPWRTTESSFKALENTFLFLTKCTQQLLFAFEFSKAVFWKPLRKLVTFVDQEGYYVLVIVSNRHTFLMICNILPRERLLTSFLYHKKYLQAGLLSQTFWILAPERAINPVLSKCTILEKESCRIPSAHGKFTYFANFLSNTFYVLWS